MSSVTVDGKVRLLMNVSFVFRARELALENREAELKKAEAMAARTDAVESRALARVRSILTK